MSTFNMLPRLIVALFLIWVLAAVATAANRTWIGGNADWTTSNANWSSSDEPDEDDVAVFNTANTVNLAIGAQTILGLTLSGGINLSTNGNDLTVNGLVELSDAGTDLTVGGAGSLLTADSITINSGGDVTLTGGQITIIEETGSGVLDVNNGGELSGNGIIQFSDAVAAGTQLFNMDGTLTAHSTAPDDLFSFAAATLTINVADSDGLIDLDGNDGVSTINVLRNDTLAINGGVLDSAYSGTINLSAGATFSRNVAWSLDGTLNANTASSTEASISGAAFTQTGGGSSINVDAGETLRISSTFHATDGVIANNGLIKFNTATIDNAVQFQTGVSGSLEANAHVSIFDQGWDWDGNGGADNVITIGNTGWLDVFSPADDTWDGLMNINGGTLSMSAADGTWGQAGGTINVNSAPSFSDLSSPHLFVMSGGAFNVTIGGDLYFNSPSSWSGGTLDVDGLVLFQSPVTFDGAAITGNGRLVTENNAVVTSNTSIDVNTFDWDGDILAINNTQTINAGVTFTINSPNFDTDGDMDDAIFLDGRTAHLNVNGPAQWTMNNTLTIDNGIQAFIGGTSRMVLRGMLDANVGLKVDAPMTFGPGSVADVAAGHVLWVTSAATRYSGGLITGGSGIYIPGTSNIVESNSTININTFGFDFGSWTINAGATLTVDVVSSNYGVTTFFDNLITINSGTADLTTGAPTFVFNNATLNLNNTTGAAAVWTGEPIEVGDDDAAFHAHLNAGGAGISRINSAITFNSDAIVNIATGATLVLGGSVSFNPASGANNAQFTGAGTLVTNGATTVGEATTFNMSGGTVDFDGENSDTTGNIITIAGPLIINAANFESFGVLKMPGPGDRIDINSIATTGSLAVNLVDPNAEWTVDPAGALRLFNDNTNEVLLTGSDVNLNGEFRATGEVQSNARLDIGIPGVFTIVTAGEPFHLNGGNNTDDPNTIAGGSIFGPGILAASDGHALVGFGALNANVDFDGASHLLVKDGTLFVSSTILDVGTLGTVNSTSTLYMLNPWNTNVADLVQLNGGEITAGAITNDGAAGINGFGLISARVINNTRIDAENGPLLVETFANDNDWDGAGAGALNAVSGNLEVRDDTTFQFTGTVSAAAGREIFANDFELEFEPASTLSLADGARYRSTNGTHLGGAVMVTGGTASLETDATAVFESGSTVTLTGNLRLENPLTVVEAGASFGGGGTLNNAAGRTLQLLDGANVGVLIKNQGTLELGASAGQVQGVDFQQDSAGLLEIELAGTGLNDFDRMTLIGQALLGGELNVSLLDGFSPVAGNAFNFLSAVGGVAGTFNAVSLPALTAGLSWSINYNPTNVQLLVVQALAGDFNGDGIVDAADYVVWRKGLGTTYTQNDHDIWRAHFGQTSGSGSVTGASSAVPEPGTLLQITLVAAVWCLRQYRSAWKFSNTH